MNVVWGTEPEFNEALGEWAALKIWGDERRFSAFKAMGIFREGVLIAVAVFHNWDPHAGVIEISGASDSKLWLTRPVIREMFEYAFLTAGCQMVVQRVSADNKKLHRILTAYGYEAYTVHRLRGRHEDEIIFTLTDDSWRNNRFNKVIDYGQAEVSRAA